MLCCFTDPKLNMFKSAHGDSIHIQSAQRRAEWIVQVKGKPPDLQMNRPSKRKASRPTAFAGQVVPGLPTSRFQGTPGCGLRARPKFRIRGRDCWGQFKDKDRRNRHRNHFFSFALISAVNFCLPASFCSINKDILSKLYTMRSFKWKTRLSLRFSSRSKKRNTRGPRKTYTWRSRTKHSTYIFHCGLSELAGHLYSGALLEKPQRQPVRLGPYHTKLIAGLGIGNRITKRWQKTMNVSRYQW
jgi:hypothetical protein